MKNLSLKKIILVLGLFGLSLACSLTDWAASPTGTSETPVPPTMAPSETLTPAPTPVPSETPLPPLETLTPTAPVVPDENTVLLYEDPIFGFEIEYPAGSTLGGNWGLTAIYLPVMPGTNLGEKFVTLAARRNQKTCSGAEYIGAPSGEPPTEIDVNGLKFSVEYGMDAGAGNYYDSVSYSTTHQDVCVSLVFVLHSTNRMNYPTPPPEFDRELESKIFETMLASFRWK